MCVPSDGLGGPSIAHLHHIVQVIAHSDEQVKEKFTAPFHLRLHGSAPLKCLATSDDQGEVMSAESRVGVRRVVIGILRRAQNGGDVDSALEALLAQRQTLELLESVPFSGAIYDGVPKEVLSHAGHVDCRLDGPAAASVF